MELRVLQPGRSQRRRRSGWRARSLLLLIGLLAVAAGVFVATRGRTHPVAPRPRQRAVGLGAPRHTAPEPLLVGPMLLHRSVALRAPAAIVIDARTGRL